MGQGLDRHPLHARTRGVITEGGTGGEQGVTRRSIGMDHRMDRSIHTVEEPHLVDGQGMGEARWRRLQIGDQGLTQSVVFRIHRHLISRVGANGFGDRWAGTNRVLVEVEPQQTPAPLQGRAVTPEAFHIGTGFGCRNRFRHGHQR